MTSNKRELTEGFVSNLRPPSPGQTRIEFHDKEQRGLLLRVTPAGTKSWSVAYRVAGLGGRGERSVRKGKQRRMTLGTFPEMSVAEAREAARLARSSANTGNDPTFER